MTECAQARILHTSMKPITVVLSATDVRLSPDALSHYLKHADIEVIIAISPSTPEMEGVRTVEGNSIFSGAVMTDVLEIAKTDYLLVLLPGGKVEWAPMGIARLLQVTKDSRSGIVYSDYRDVSETSPSTLFDHPLIDYHIGSVRDSFDFGGAVLISKAKALEALTECGPVDSKLEYGALYDLRLKLSEVSQIGRVPEYLYLRHPIDRRESGERIFDYVNPSQRAYQIEMESVVTSHLKRIGAHLLPAGAALYKDTQTFPVEATVVIPVRNRARTIEDSVRSALSQQTTFSYNLIVVDNHSSDGTSEKLARLCSEDERLIVIQPARLDLGIGGCWNEAVFSEKCGRFAVQLDSDDLYANTNTLETMVTALKAGPYAMVIGSYTIVDFDLNVLPPGVIDHREWTDDNGLNNALRINGLGAPRAFDVSVVRRFGFPNVSYGEDYAVALRLCRDYRIGRVYDSVYMARRWGGNSDSNLPLETMNRYDAYKDWVRAQEILARIEKNRNV